MWLKWRPSSQQDGKRRPDKMRGRIKKNKCYEEDIAIAITTTTTKTNIKQTEYRTAMLKRSASEEQRGTPEEKKSY